MIPSNSMFMAKERMPSMGLKSPRPIDAAPGKTEQSMADYSGPDDRCSACEHFDGVSSCSKVEGEISPEGHSKYFERKDDSRFSNDEGDEG